MILLTQKAAKRSADPRITWKQLLELPQEDTRCAACEAVQQWCMHLTIQWIDKLSSTYHYKLSRLPSPPPVVYRKGDIWLLDANLLAIVWPRLSSPFLQNVTKDICSRLHAYRVVTLSWGAEGIDTLAHQYSLDAWVPTIVVLGWWFRWYQHRRERAFFEQIVAAWGLILSEWKLDQPPTHYTFPQRNRIIACCADVVFVPWAALWSWSLITVDFAREFGIPVVTVPWSYYEQTCAWTNAYLCQQKIWGTIDLDAFLTHYFQKKQQTNHFAHSQQDDLSDDERRVLSMMKQQPVELSYLLQELSWELPYLLEVLLWLEMKQRMYTTQPWWYAVKN